MNEREGEGGMDGGRKDGQKEGKNRGREEGKEKKREQRGRKLGMVMYTLNSTRTTSCWKQGQNNDIIVDCFPCKTINKSQKLQFHIL